jgi:PTS system mannose-specific IIA component
MVGVIVISESKASAEMLKTVEGAIGRKSFRGIVPLVIKSDFTRRTLEDKINQTIKRLGARAGVVILTELYGSTQSNVCMEFLQRGEIELVCGYNLPMLMKAATANQKSTLDELVATLTEAGKKYIRSFKR